MAKFNEREGNSCHIHLSVRGTDGTPVMADDGSPLRILEAHGALDRRASSRRCASSRCSSRPTSTRTSATSTGSFAPTAVAWGLDNRTCALRVVGHGHSLRVENRVPGGDVNQYLAIAAIIAGGLYGIENELELEPIFDRQRLRRRMPTACRPRCGKPRSCSPESTIARAAFGDDIVEHYLNNARIELEAYDAAVTDWERVRGFERL